MAHAVSAMSNRLQNNGFSLTEVLMAAGILAIGFAFIAGMFPVGVKLTAIATEQTIAPIVADEAIAKVKLYADPNFVEALGQAQLTSQSTYIDFDDLMFQRDFVIDPCEFAYPSARINPEPKKYHWSVLCGLLPDGNVHIIIFVGRKAGVGARYRTPNSNYTQPNYGLVPSGPVDGDWPVPVKVGVTASVDPGEERVLAIIKPEYETFINSGSTILDDATGRIYRVMKRTSDGVITLDREWRNWVVPSGDFVWVVPPAEGSGREPCIGVYQTVIGF